MSLRHSAHAVWDCQYHLVFVPKRRRPVLAGEVGERMGQLLRQIGEAYDIEFTELVVASDHVHALCCFPPRLSVSEAVKVLKSFSARTLFQEYPLLRQRLYGGQFWAGGYFVRTVGSGVDAETVLAYIQSHRDQDPAL